MVPANEFKANVEKALDRHQGGWVVDSTFNIMLGEVLGSRVTDTICAIIFLDMPRFLSC